MQHPEFLLASSEGYMLLLATRHVGDSLFPIQRWPVFVHVAGPLVENPEHREVIHDSQFEPIAWAELYQTSEDARLKKM